MQKSRMATGWTAVKSITGGSNQNSTLEGGSGTQGMSYLFTLNNSGQIMRYQVDNYIGTLRLKNRALVASGQTNIKFLFSGGYIYSTSSTGLRTYSDLIFGVTTGGGLVSFTVPKQWDPVYSPKDKPVRTVQATSGFGSFVAAAASGCNATSSKDIGILGVTSTGATQYRYIPNMFDSIAGSSLKGRYATKWTAKHYGA